MVGEKACHCLQSPESGAQSATASQPGASAFMHYMRETQCETRLVYPGPPGRHALAGSRCLSRRADDTTRTRLCSGCARGRECMGKRDNDPPEDHRAEPTGADGTIGNGKRGVTTAPVTP